MTDEPLPLTDLKRASYELFAFALSAIAVFNTVLIITGLTNEIVAEVLRTINVVLAVYFLADFLLRLLRAESKSQYFFRRFGWSDMLSGVPVPLFQLFRLTRMTSSVRILHRLGGRSVFREIRRNRAGGALYFAIVLAVVLIEVASASIVSVEARSPGANIKTASDAIWWAYVTVTTVGYGDYYPVTNTGRVLGVLVMTIGVGLFGVFSGFLANAFLGHSRGQIGSSSLNNTVDILSKDGSDKTLQMRDIETLLAQQEATFAELRLRIEAMDAQLRQAGIEVDAGGATIRSDAVQPE